MRQWFHNLFSNVSPILVVVLVVVAVMIPAAIVLSGRGDSSSPPAAQPSASVSTTPSSATTASPSPSQTVNGCAVATDLDTRVQCFIKAWYLLKPDDSTASKRARVQPYASESFMSVYADGMTVETTSAADQARITAKLTQSGETAGEILSEPDGESSQVMRVFTSVILSESKGTEASTPQLTVFTEMLWSNTSGTWRVDSVSDVVGGGP